MTLFLRAFIFLNLSKFIQNCSFHIAEEFGFDNNIFIFTLPIA
jgi:hypothetical protein